MSAIGVRSYAFRYAFPVREEPEWKHLVDRWYQLDAQSYGLAQAYWHWKPRMGEAPSLLILASPGASNETDRAFVVSGATSPAKFTHTLPNVRSSPLCQVMAWSGPMLCLQRDPATQITALAQAAEWVGAEYPRVWVVACGRDGAGYVVRGWTLGVDSGELAMHRKGARGEASGTDGDFEKWIESETRAREFWLTNGWVIEWMRQ